MHPPSRVTGLPALRTLLVLLSLTALLTGGCESTHAFNVAAHTPTFADDGDRSSLVTATGHQIDYLGRLPRDSVVTIQGDTYTIGWLLESLHLFLDIVRQNPQPEELDRILHETFTVYQAHGRTSAPAGEMLITGYYQPLFAGSLSKTPPFLHPLYTQPASLTIQKRPDSGKTLIGRLDGKGELIPFWTRAEIEDNNLLAGNELVYLQDPVDAFFLQIQGSGRIRLQDGSLRSVHISASNGREYKSIGKLLVDEHKIAKPDISMQTIRQYLREHPAEIKRILQYNRKFVFFRWEEGEPQGRLGEVLTPGRSIAIDHDALPTGAIAYIVTQRPVMDTDGTVTRWEPLRRFVLPQDSGEAIKGTGRADVFWGNGLYAETTAGLMKEKGQLYFLVKKQH
jgi:membrane-bound lytic murein transglycosylase A